MRINLLSTICAAFCCVVAHQTNASQAFPAPTNGWTYVFDCNQLANACTRPATTFDGTWITGGGSDSWDGSTNGGGAFNNTCNRPGGFSQYTEGGVTFIRMQDPGDPRGAGFTDPSNRKLMVGRRLDDDGASTTYLADGFTFNFRARIPTPSNTTNPIDPLYLSTSPSPYPTNGDGYVTFDGGKGNFTLHDGEPPPGGIGPPLDATLRGASIAFSLTQIGDSVGTLTSSFAGLTMNELAGNIANNNVNFGQGSGTNLFPCDPTQWHEFWITIKADPTGIGTHICYIFMDGDLNPKIIRLTAGGSSGAADYGNASPYITMSSPATGQSCALDTDFIAYKLGDFFPPGAILPPAILAIRPFIGQPFYATSSNIVVRVDPFGTNTISTTGAQLTLNGVDVSSGLAASGTSVDRTFTYSSLLPNTIYSGRIIVTDSGGHSVTNAFAFDTFLETSVTIVETEDYNYNQGQFKNTTTPGSDDYNALPGTYNIDFLDSSLQTVGLVYRADAVDVNVSADFVRPRFASAGTDCQIGGIVKGEWLNYTRSFTGGRYKVYLRAAATTAQDIRVDLVSNPTVANQTRKLLGTFHVPNTGSLISYANVPLTDLAGNDLPIALVAGNNTLRLTAASDISESATLEDANNNLSLNYVILAQAGTPSAPAVVTTPAASETGVSPGKTIEAAIYDGTSPVDVNTVTLTVNGSPVTPTSKSKSGSITTVTYTPAALWPVLSSNYVTLAFNDGTARSASWGFTVAYLPTLTPGMKVTNAATNGFVFKTFANPDNQAALVIRAKLAMMGQLTNSSGVVLENLGDNTSMGPADGNGTPDPPTTGPFTFHIPTVINMSTASGYGNFDSDDVFPGMGTAGDSGWNAQAIGLVQLPAGVNTMVFDCQDGFEVDAGFLNDAPLVLLHFDGQLGTGNQHPISFIVQQAGVYPFQIFWFHVQHQAALEWGYINPDGRYGLVNNDNVVNPDQPGPASFSSGTIPAAPHPTLTITRAGGGNVTITWGSVGTLQMATSVSGPYQDVLTASSPYTTSAAGGRTFYRVKVP